MCADARFFFAFFSFTNNVFSVNLAVVRNDELCIRVSPSSANSAKNLDIGLIIKGSV